MKREYRRSLAILLFLGVAWAGGVACPALARAEGEAGAAGGSADPVAIGDVDDALEFDPAVDDELIDFIEARSGEQPGIQPRSADPRRTRASEFALRPAKKTTAGEFAKVIEEAQLRDAVGHVEAVRRGARPDAAVVVAALREIQRAKPDSNSRRLVFQVFRTSLQQVRSDGARHQETLRRHQESMALIQQKLRQLWEALEREKSGGEGCSADGSGDQPVDTSSLDPDLRAEADRIIREQSWLKGVSGLEQVIKEVEAIHVQVRDRRQTAFTAFENFDQKANQLFNLITTVLKNMREMQQGVTRNPL